MRLILSLTLFSLRFAQRGFVSVIVDLAAANGGNVDASVPDSVITTPNGVTIVGYTDLPSRLPATSSSLFSNNLKNFLLSIGPQTTKEKGYFHIDTKDEAVDNMMIVKDGKVRWGTDEITPYSPPPVKEVAAVDVKTPEEIQMEEAKKNKDEFIQTITYGTVAAIALTLVGAKGGASSLLATFALAGLAGQQVRVCEELKRRVYWILTYMPDTSMYNVATAKFFAISNVTNHPSVAARFARRRLFGVSRRRFIVRSWRLQTRSVDSPP